MIHSPDFRHNTNFRKKSKTVTFILFLNAALVQFQKNLRNRFEKKSNVDFGPIRISVKIWALSHYVFIDLSLTSDKKSEKNKPILTKWWDRRTDGQSCIHRDLQQSQKFNNTKNSNRNKYLIVKLCKKARTNSESNSISLQHIVFFNQLLDCPKTNFGPLTTYQVLITVHWLVRAEDNRELWLGSTKD